MFGSFSSSHRHCLVKFTAPDMYLEAEWSFEDFLRAAGQRLYMSNGAAKRAFHCNGK
jgi:hypothetical protein